jgi:hypothetical protein
MHTDWQLALGKPDMHRASEVRGRSKHQCADLGIRVISAAVHFQLNELNDYLVQWMACIDA